MLWLRHAVDDERDEEDVGEGGVDASVQGNPPLLAEPGRVVDTCPVGRPVKWDTGVSAKEYDIF